MKIFKIDQPNNPKEYLQELQLDSGGIAIISQKMNLHFFSIKNLKAPAVNILKQDALSAKAELATPRGAIACQKESFDCLLIGTKRELLRVAKKLYAQPFGLKNIAAFLESSLNTPTFKTKIMGIINANSDSFYSNSRFVGKKAVEQIDKMINDGANIIDIGAVSSRPGSKAVSPKEELNRVKEILDTIKTQELYEKVDFSIDSYTPEVVEYALKCGFKYVNDITGATNSELIKLAVKYNAKYIIMHMQGTPQTMQDNPTYDCVVSEVDDFFAKQIAKCQEFGLNKSNIILDVGIGFGKSLEHNIALLKAHEHFCHFGCEMLIGASRKSMIDKIIPTPTQNRLPGTLAIHLKAAQRGATIIRCHDILEHKQALKVWLAI